MQMRAKITDYIELCKPKVVALMLITAVVGMYLSVPGAISVVTLGVSLLGIALSASSAAVVNHLVDRRIDAIMARTHKRPVAQGRIAVKNAMLFALTLGLIGLLLLGALVNILTACLTFITLI